MRKADQHNARTYTDSSALRLSLVNKKRTECGATIWVDRETQGAEMLCVCGNVAQQKGQMVFKQIKQIANYSCYLSLIIGSFFILSLHISFAPFSPIPTSFRMALTIRGSFYRCSFFCSFFLIHSFIISHLVEALLAITSNKLKLHRSRTCSHDLDYDCDRVCVCRILHSAWQTLHWMRLALMRTCRFRYAAKQLLMCVLIYFMLLSLFVYTEIIEWNLIMSCG